MATGEGRSLLYKDIGQEQAFELSRYNRELSSAEDALEKDVAGSSLWSFLGSVLATTGTALVGPKDPKSLMKAWAVGGEAGKWAQRGLSGYDPEDYAITTDPGKFDVSQRYDFEDVNRQFESAKKSRFWKDVTGTGTTVASILALGANGEGGENLWTKYFGGGESDDIFIHGLTRPEYESSLKTLVK